MQNRNRTDMIVGKILPLHVLGKEIQEEEKTESGLLITPIAVMKKEHKTAEVVMVGAGTANEEMQVKCGDKILFSPHAFRKFVHPLDNQEYLLVAQRDVMLIW